MTEVICLFEAYFLLTFFDISIHLLYIWLRILGILEWCSSTTCTCMRDSWVLCIGMSRVMFISRVALCSAILLRSWATGALVTLTPLIQSVSLSLVMREGYGVEGMLGRSSLLYIDVDAFKQAKYCVLQHTIEVRHYIERIWKCWGNKTHTRAKLG